MKFVSTSTLYGGPRSVLCDKNNLSLVTILFSSKGGPYEDDTCCLNDKLSSTEGRGRRHTLVSSLRWSYPFPPFLLLFRHFPSCRISFDRCWEGLGAYNLGSLGLIIRLTAANLRVCFAFPWAISSFLSHFAGWAMIICPSLLVARLTILSISL
jgi:hypothetical protein